MKGRKVRGMGIWIEGCGKVEYGEVLKVINVIG